MGSVTKLRLLGLRMVNDVVSLLIRKESAIKRSGISLTKIDIINLFYNTTDLFMIYGLFNIFIEFINLWLVKSYGFLKNSLIL